MSFDWSILFQIPLVAAFIWYSISVQKQHLDSMAKRDQAYLAALNRICDDVKANTAVINQMLEKVSPNKSRR